MKLLRYTIPLCILLALTNISCSVYQSIVNISRLKFKINSVNNFSIAGVQLSNKRSIQDFTALEGLKLTAAFANGSLPSSFTLNIDALNPNDGKGGYPKTNATIKAFPWRLLLQEKETISGNLGSPVTVPGTGESIIIPLGISIDLYSFFRDRGYNDLLNLALNIGGAGGDPSKVALYAKPTITSSIGDLTYPQEIKIVNYEFSK